jgi:hypothetical protein
MRVDVLQKRRAMAALVPINDQIGPWQTKTARLLAYAERLRATGGYEPTIAAEVEALSKAVSMQQNRLLETTRELPPDIASNTRVLDTARALKSVATGLEAARDLLRRGQVGGPDVQALSQQH